ncbi:MAG TPA: hypothetical protein VKY85_23675 [Candidatus Angelobacter sp.]|nr:hypothetical protein [Candidatus Angelobacter sp.]
MATDKQHAHQLPLSRLLAMVPVEEEQITPETAAALRRSHAALGRGEGTPHEEIRREFGMDSTIHP